MKILGYTVTGWAFRDGEGNLLCLRKETDIETLNIKVPIPRRLSKEKDIVSYVKYVIKSWERDDQLKKQRKALERLESG